MTRQVRADREVCIGAGICAMLAPHAFTQDEDDGRVVMLTDRPDPDDAAVQDAISNCPSGALHLDEH